ncbi:MAG: T9SS type A sorting domain-containing protein [Chitinophagales bacterium]|nr:T9SS type A sorting domain-containing protein [Chitinophagales bacterium]MDW8419795.1 T9SS type A sorting domain-containing protein [Chitinophagales bacterium]
MKRIFIVSVFATAVLGVYAQRTISPSGGEATGSGGTVSFTIGQIDYIFQSGSNGNLHQGVQQPYELFTVSITEAAKPFSIRVFPNPTAHSITIQSDAPSGEPLTLLLYDTQGKLIYRQPHHTQHSEIDMSAYASGQYLLHILHSQKQQPLQTIQIIKHD